LLVAAVVIMSGCHGSDRTAEPAAATGQEMDRPLAPQVVDATLVDSSGRRLTISSLRGKIVVISDMMTLCQGTCPLDTANVVQAARRVQAAGEDSRVVFLS